MSKDGIETDPKKIAVIKDWPVPKTMTEVQFLRFYLIIYIIIIGNLYKNTPTLPNLSIYWCLEKMLIKGGVLWNGLLSASRLLSS